MGENIFNADLLLAIITALSVLQIAIVGYFARKYIRQIDRNSDTITTLKAEHCVFHKTETGIK